MSSAWYSWQDDALIINIRVQPRASHNGFAEPLGEYRKVRLTAPPVEGKANRALLKFLAKACGVSGAQVSLLSGDTSRNKRVRIESPRNLPDGVRRPET